MMKWVFVTALVLLLLISSLQIQAGVIYKFHFDNSNTGSWPESTEYTLGPGDIVSGGMSSVVGPAVNITTPTPIGLEGNNALGQTLGASWPNVQGIEFTNGEAVKNVWSVEMVVKPDFSGCAFGLSGISTLIDSETVDGVNNGDFRLYVDQNTGKVHFSPNTSVSPTGEITSTTVLQSGQWYDIAVVVRTGAVQRTELWINGTLDGTGSYPSGWETTGTYQIPGYFRIGGSYWGMNQRNWQGQIDAVAITDDVRDADSFVLRGLCYKLNFNNAGTGQWTPWTAYTTSAGDIFPSGASALVRDGTLNILTPAPSGPLGGNVAEQPLGAAWTNQQGIALSNGPVIQNSWTLEAVVNPDFSGCAFGKEPNSHIFNSYTSDGLNMGDVDLVVDQNTGIVSFYPWNGTDYGKVISPVVIHSGQWYHIAAVVRPGITQQTELWINGQLVGTGNYPSGWETQGQYRIPSHFVIGGWEWTTGRNWQGMIDAVAISDRAREAGSFMLPSGTPDKVYINVKDCGAKGDGTTDDTIAIQAAMNAAEAQNLYEEYSSGPYFNSNAVVFFPSGKYVLSDTITLKADAIGEGQAVLYQTNSQKDIFSQPGIWRCNITSMGFLGGKNHISLGTNNVANAQINIDKCQFNSAADCAVRTLSGSNSTKIVLKDCTIALCNQAFVNYCDSAEISDTWIYSLNTMTNKAVIENRGTLLAENICGVPYVVSGNDQRWIDNYGSVTCRNFRFGGESAGFTAVVNWAAYRYQAPVVPTSVVLDNCDIYAAGNPTRHCAVYCEEIPNELTITRCRGLIDITALQVRSSINLNTYLDNGETYAYDTLKYLIDRSNSPVYTNIIDLPEQMRPHQVNEIQADAAPTTGNWRAGAFVRRRATSPGTLYGWKCTTAGEPGVWQNVTITY